MTNFDTFASKIPLLMAAVALLVTTGCSRQYATSSYHRSLEALGFRDSHGISRPVGWRLDTETRLYLVRPDYPLDVDADPDRYGRARFALLQALELALVETYPDTRATMASMSLEEARYQAQLLDRQVLVYPRLTTYEDQADRVGKDRRPFFASDSTRFQVLLIDVYSGQVLDAALIESASSRFNIAASAASDLFTDAARQYVARLSGIAPADS